jgi:hypothetical protein
LFPGKNLPTLELMAKQVLGRNLGALLDGNAKKVAGPFAAEKAPMGSGVRSLMRGQQPAEAKLATAEPARKSIVPGWYLFGADILLGALALIVVCKSPHPLTWPKELFCAGAIVLGGCLALGAVLLGDE